MKQCAETFRSRIVPKYGCASQSSALVKSISTDGPPNSPGGSEMLCTTSRLMSEGSGRSSQFGEATKRTSRRRCVEGSTSGHGSSSSAGGPELRPSESVLVAITPIDSCALKRGIRMKIVYALAASLLVAGCAATEYKMQGVTISYEPYGDTAPAPKSAKLPEVDIPFTKHILSNGLTLVVHEDHSAPVVGVSVWYHVGSKNEKPGKTGFAHLFEHLMFNGSEHFKDEFFRPFEKVGATDMNGDTWLDRTRYFETVPTTALDMALWMESDRMGHLLDAIDQKTLDEQRGVVQNEKRQSVDNAPYGRVGELQQRASFPEGHPYRWETIGSMEDLNAASLADVKEWFREYYGAGNVTLVLSGDIDDKTAVEKATRY